MNIKQWSDANRVIRAIFVPGDGWQIFIRPNDGSFGLWPAITLRFVPSGMFASIEELQQALRKLADPYQSCEEGVTFDACHS
jgi:hypothetical protein